MDLRHESMQVFHMPLKLVPLLTVPHEITVVQIWRTRFWLTWRYFSKITCFHIHDGICNYETRLESSSYSRNIYLPYLVQTALYDMEETSTIFSRSHNFTMMFCNFYLAALRPTLGRYQGDSLTHLMLITTFLQFRPKDTESFVTKLGL